MVDQPKNPVLPEEPPEDPSVPENLDSPELRGLPDTQSVEGEEEVEESDDVSLEAAFKLHDQICSRVEAAATSLHEIFPLIEKLSEKISEGDNLEYRLDRRLRIPSLVQTVVAAHSHLNKAAKSARIVSAIQKDDLAENPRPAFE